MHTDRVKRFAAVMEKRCGAFEDPLSEETLRVLQREILGPRATRYGVRRSPVFVGEVDSYVQVVHYIAPHWEQIPDLLDGLRRFFVATHGGSPLVRAAVMSFGFVYLHPMADGNGRISRFLINDVLRRDGAVPAPFILPVSATIVRSVANRRGYDQVLALFSRPFMRRYQEAWHFGAERTGADGVRCDLDFDAYDDALAAWRYPDFTDHVEYLGRGMTTHDNPECPIAYDKTLFLEGNGTNVLYLNSRVVFETPERLKVLGIIADIDARTQAVEKLKALSEQLRSYAADHDGKLPDALSQLKGYTCLLYTSPSPRDRTRSRMPSSA